MIGRIEKEGFASINEAIAEVLDEYQQPLEMLNVLGQK